MDAREAIDRTGTTGACAPYDCIFFDLDGTLLPMDLDVFMRKYMELLGAFFASRGMDVGTEAAAIFSATRAMAENAGEVLNADAFWEEYCRITNSTRDVREPLLFEFYLGDFNRLADGLEPSGNMLGAVAELQRKGYPMAVTTMPLFPIEASLERIEWAGLDPNDFLFVTAYDNSTAIKPQLEYYRECLNRVKCPPERVLMVGNNTLEDGVAAQLGCDLYLVTDFLIEREGGVELSATKHGTSADFLAFCEALPPLA